MFRRATHSTSFPATLRDMCVWSGRRERGHILENEQALLHTRRWDICSINRSANPVTTAGKFFMSVPVFYRYVSLRCSVAALGCKIIRDYGRQTRADHSCTHFLPSPHHTIFTGRDSVSCSSHFSISVPPSCTASEYSALETPAEALHIRIATATRTAVDKPKNKIDLNVLSMRS